jgi:hypothetical protein
MALIFILFILNTLIIVSNAVYENHRSRAKYLVLKEIKDDIKKHIKDSMANQQILVKRIEHENNNVKFLNQNLHLFHEELESNLKRIEGKLNEK